MEFRMKVLGIFESPNKEPYGWSFFQQKQIEEQIIFASQTDNLVDDINSRIDQFDPDIIFTCNTHENKEIFMTVLENKKVINLVVTDLPAHEYCNKMLCKISKECCLYFAKSANLHRKNVISILTAIRLGHDCVGAEIGVYKGITSLYLATQPHIKKIYAIDPWDEIEGYEDSLSLIKDIRRSDTHGPAMKANSWDNLYLEVSEKLSQQDKIVILREHSSLACALFADESLDFVFIDGDHSYESVYFDIEAWYPKVKKGGLILGHDFTWHGESGDKRGLVKAVHDFFGDNSDLFVPVLEPKRNKFINRADNRIWWQQRLGDK
jgi:hypothetical protein